VVVNASAVNVRSDEKSVMALRPAHGEVVANRVGLLRRDLAGGEGLPHLIAQHIGVPLLLPARDRLVLGLAQQKFRVGAFMVAFIRGNKLTAVGFAFVFSVIEPVFKGGSDGPSAADSVNDKTRGRHGQPSFPLAHNDSRKLFPNSGTQSPLSVMLAVKELCVSSRLCVDYGFLFRCDLQHEKRAQRKAVGIDLHLLVKCRFGIQVN